MVIFWNFAGVPFVSANPLWFSLAYVHYSPMFTPLCTWLPMIPLHTGSLPLAI